MTARSRDASRRDSGARPIRPRARVVAAAAAVAAVGLVAIGWWWQFGRPWTAMAPAIPAARYVGHEACGRCHADAERSWRGSHHALAMQPASEATVAGDFDGAHFTYAGVTSTFTRRDGNFVVRTDGPDGALRDYEVAYTFGVWPLQQYLIPFPDGRLQALSIAWDTRPRALGGQRWFHLYPGEQVTHRDPLHWTGLSQNWNHMCAECHSTAVRKNYDPKTRTFSTTYAEVHVACEACHGPGSNHVVWADKEGDWRRFDDGTKGLAVALDERRGMSWAIDPTTGNARRTPPARPAWEIDTCGRCHARRGQLTDAYVHGRPLGDTHRVALLEDGLYHADGQIRDEVYEYGSFLQSKMFAHGVTCSDCHDPHSGKLRAPGGQVCLGCHAADRYQTPNHHFHPADSRGADCVGCHMPATTYMVVDPRHDHGFRVPRPDLSVTLGVPNACTRCHADRPPAWAAEHVAARYAGAPRGHQRYAEALHAGSLGAPGAAAMLRAVARDGAQPAIARATALERLGAVAGGAVPEIARAGVRDADPLVRRAAARALDGADLATRIELLAPLLSDIVRDVRLEAARALAGARDRLPETHRPAFDRGLEEYIAAQQLDADRPAAHLNLGLLYLARQRSEEAEAALRAALDLDPGFVPASVNLADLYRATGRDAEGERVLRAAIGHDARSPAARHALGLLLVRQQRTHEAVAELHAAARLAPESARYGYVYAVALHDTGRPREAMAVLARLLARHPYDRDALAAQISYALEQRDSGQALAHARRLAELEPGNAEVRRLVERLAAERRP